MSFKRLLVKTRLTGKPMPDYVIVKDYGVKQGLVLFFPLDSVNPGNIESYSGTGLDSPWTVNDPMSFEEAPLEWFYKGRAPKKTDIRVDDLLKRYQRDFKFGLTLVRIYKDRAEYRAYRESR